MSSAATRVVRRSALEAAHAALQARWVADDIRWPLGYGDRDAASDTATLAVGAGLAEIGPFDELLLRGPGALAAGARTAVERASRDAGRVVVADLHGQHGLAWLLGPDEVLLVAPLGAGALADLASELASDDVSTIEMTGARTTLRLAGASAPSILAELCEADTTPATMREADLVQAPLAGVRAYIARQDADSRIGYTIMVARDEAAYLWSAICRIGALHGLTPVGPAAVRADSST